MKKIFTMSLMFAALVSTAFAGESDQGKYQGQSQGQDYSYGDEGRDHHTYTHSSRNTYYSDSCDAYRSSRYRRGNRHAYRGGRSYYDRSLRRTCYYYPPFRDNSIACSDLIGRPDLGDFWECQQRNGN